MLKRGWEVFTALVAAELRQSREFSLIGVVKWIIEPLSYMVVYFVLVATLMNRPQEAYPLFLLSALVPFRYFTGVVGECLLLVKRYADVITNLSIPTPVLPLVVMASEGLTLLIALGLFLPFLIAYEINPGGALFWLPVLFLQVGMVTVGLAYLASVVGLYFPNMRGPIQNLVRASFFLSSGLVSLSSIPGDRLPDLIRANPLTGMFDSFRAVFLEATSPDAFDLLYPMGAGALFLLVGGGVYAWRQRDFPKEV